MNITMTGTTSSAIAARLAQLRRAGGATMRGRVLTLLIVADSPAGAQAAITAANGASREHPCRVVAVVPGETTHEPRIDAEIRVGGEAGMSEVVILFPHGEPAESVDTLIIPLLLPDTPVVVWWSGTAPAVPADDPVGRIGHRRITDVAAGDRPLAELTELAPGYSPGDTDLSWARITLWRGLLAATLDDPPYEPVTAVRVRGGDQRPATHLLAAWLAHALDVPASVTIEPGIAVTSVELDRPSGTVSLYRAPGTAVAVLERPGRVSQQINLPVRTLADCLTEELRRLDADETYGAALTAGLSRVTGPTKETA